MARAAGRLDPGARVVPRGLQLWADWVMGKKLLVVAAGVLQPAVLLRARGAGTRHLPLMQSQKAVLCIFWPRPRPGIVRSDDGTAQADGEGASLARLSLLF